MVFVEKRERNGHMYFYLAKPFREKGKVKKKRVFLGTDLNTLQLQKLAADAKVVLGEIDFEKVLLKKETMEFEQLKNEINRAIASFDLENFYQHFLTEFTYDSNAIEGSSLTLQETGNLLFEGISPRNKPEKHVQEAKNHKEAFDFVSSLKQTKISQALICKIQRLVVQKTLPQYLQEFEGKLRSLNVRVGNHVAPPYYSVPRKLGALIKWYNANWQKYHPTVIAAYFHSEFENIHPFVDGNGRTGRLLMNYMLKQKGYPLITIFFSYRQKYYRALEAAREKKNLKPLINIMKNCYKKILKQYAAKEQ